MMTVFIWKRLCIFIGFEYPKIMNQLDNTSTSRDNPAIPRATGRHRHYRAFFVKP